MSEMDEAMDALAHMILDQTRKLGVRKLTVTPDSETGVVEVEVTLRPGLSDEVQALVAYQLVQARSFYLDELAIAYSMVESDDLIVVPDQSYRAPGAELTYA